MDRFSFFFAFYGLLLGLAVAELLGGFARIVRAKAIRKIEAQTALAAILIFLLICATWIDAFGLLENVTLDFAGLWAPIVTGTAYFLAATVLFPTEDTEFDQLASYFAERKRFIAAMLLLAETSVNFTALDFYSTMYREHPAPFWLVFFPMNLFINLIFVALIFVKGRRATVGLLATQVLLFIVIYWSKGAMVDFATEHFGGLWK